jgi:hypothetical protein
VDLATPDALHRDMKEDILKEAIRAAYNQNRKMEETSLSPHNKKCKQNMRL